MGYKFTTGETAANGIRRIACEQIDKAIAEVEDEELDVHETIHQVRKRCKKLRGLVRLVRPHMEKVYQEENAWYRDCSKNLSRFRDAQALIESFDELLQHFPPTVKVEDLSQLRRELVTRREKIIAENADVKDRLNAFLDKMRQGRERIDAWPLKKEDFDLLEKGLVKTYRRGRKAMQRAYEQLTVEAFHEWRKRVKYHWYHARLLQNAWPNLFSKYCEELKQLSDYLGDDHDLAVLRRTLQGNPEQYGSREMLQVFIGLLERRQTELRLRARPLGGRIYVEKPTIHGKRLRGYWNAWQLQQTLRPKVGSLEDAGDGSND
jgi:CHAD domain-containing protein